MPIEIIDEADSTLDVDDLAKLGTFLFRQLRLDPASELSVALVDETRMTQLHERWLDEPGPTDVISVPMDEVREPELDQPLATGILGDVIICPTVAQRQAEAAGHSVQIEGRILLTHGVLHLLGNDHAGVEEARLMFARQGELLAAYAEERSE